MLRKESLKARLDHVHRVKMKGYKRADEEPNQGIKAKGTILKG